MAAIQSKYHFNLTTLTPVHIGTGRELYRNFDYILFSESKEIALLDENKVLQVIAGEGEIQEEDINRWVASIDNGEPLLDYLEKRKRKLSPEDISERRIKIKGSLPGDSKFVREQQHDLEGHAVLPGSSLKGSMRTALLTHFIDQNKGENVKTEEYLLNNRNQFNDKGLQKYFFGKSPNFDLLRNLQVGDATFGATECIKTEVLNLKRDEYIRDQSLQTFLEVIPAGQKASGRLVIDEFHKKQNIFPRSGANFLEIPKLFALFNKHTLRLVEEEIKFWDESEYNADLGLYVDILNEIAGSIRNCKEQECIIRVGFGSGWKSMTGGWHHYMPDDLYYDMVSQMRPKHAVDLTFPKTTRFQEDGVPLGFLKIS